MDALAAESATRNPALFQPLLRGGGRASAASTTVWRWLRPWCGGRRFDPSHEGESMTALALVALVLAAFPFLLALWEPAWLP